MAGVKKFLDFFVKIEPDEAHGLSDEELKKILGEDAPEAPGKRPAAPAPGRSAGTPGTSPGSRVQPTPAGVAAPRPRVADVAASAVSQLRPPLAGAPAPGDPPDFAAIYKAARVPVPAHGYDIERIATMLANPRLVGMSTAVKSNSVLMALEVASVQIDDVIADAVARDRAIDDFEAWWAGKVAQLESDKRGENAAIEEEMNRYLETQRERIRGNNEAVHHANDTFATWKDKKRVEEQRLYDSVQPFVSESANPVTLNTGTLSPPGPPKPTSPTRA